ncbi:MAG: hypothetical protein R2856_17780 [Caldilineaceae bacterium]
MRTTETLNPGLYVHRPDGTQRCDDFGALQLLEGRCTLDTGGTQIFVGDSLGQDRAHSTSLCNASTPAGASALSLGVPQSGAVDPAFELDAYTFAATNGQQLTIAVTRTDGDLNPECACTDRTQLCQASAVIGDTASKNCNIDADGEHVILVGDFWATTPAATMYPSARRRRSDPPPTAVDRRQLLQFGQAHPFLSAVGLVDGARTDDHTLVGHIWVGPGVGAVGATVGVCPDHSAS